VLVASNPNVGRANKAIPYVVIVGAFLLAVAMPLVRGGDDARQPREGVAGGPVLLEWTIANHSDQGMELYVSDPDPATQSEGGWSQGIEPCFVTNGRSREADDWRLALAPIPVDGNLDDDWPPEPFVSAGAFPGEQILLWIDVAIDGSMTVTSGRSPTPAELTSDLCSAAA
jgi:hypothetical protein